jgi:hypothetical protein
MGSWTEGSWSIVNDTIFFKMIPVYDTIWYEDRVSKIKIDSLRLAYFENNGVTGYNGGQNWEPWPLKLVCMNNKLVRLDKEGRLIKGKIKYIWSTKKTPQWFVKRE